MLFNHHVRSSRLPREGRAGGGVSNERSKDYIPLLLLKKLKKLSYTNSKYFGPKQTRVVQILKDSTTLLYLIKYRAYFRHPNERDKLRKHAVVVVVVGDGGGGR